MSRENVQIVRRVYEAHERKDFEAVFAEYDPQIEWRTDRLGDPAPGLHSIYVGHEGIRTFWREWFKAWETVTFKYEEFIDAGDKVVVVLSQRMRGRTSGVELDWRSYAQVWRISEGKVVGVEFFPTRAEALEAAGLSE
jgi:ketosteroid isomerase-like protein